MKYLNILAFGLLTIYCQSVCYSQKITAGLFSGVNYSDIHGQEIGGKWGFKPGPVQGFSLGYSFNRTLGFQTGINFSSIYYDHKLSPYDVSSQIYPVYYSPSVSSYSPSISSYSPSISSYSPEIDQSGTTDFRFLRIPLLFTVTVPLEVQFRMRAGIFFSFLQEYSNSIYYPVIEQDKPEKHDFGYVFSSGISYPCTDNLNATFDVGYLTGRKRFIENTGYRHGSSEFTIGFIYSWFIKKNNADIASKSEIDSSSEKITVTIRGGMNYSWNNGSTVTENYSAYIGPSIGFLLNFPLGQGSSFQTGFSFERKGYSIRDSSSSFYRIIKDENQIYYVDTKVQTDYAIIPALLSFPFGKSEKIILSTGPWFGFKLNARTVGTAYNEYHSGNSYQLRKTVVYDDLEKAIKDYDLGWIISCGVSIPIVKNYKVNVALQYSTGFRDVFDTSGLGSKNNPYDPGLIIRNRTFSLLLGFKIPSTDR
jgi:hypothetical protein